MAITAYQIRLSWSPIETIPCLKEVPAMFLSWGKPLHPNISIHILHTVLYTFPKVLARRICLTINQSRTFVVRDHFLYYHDLNVCFRGDVQIDSHSKGLKGWCQQNSSRCFSICTLTVHARSNTWLELSETVCMVSRLSMALVRVRVGNGKLEQSLKFTMLSSQRWRAHRAKQRKRWSFSHYF